MRNLARLDIRFRAEAAAALIGMIATGDEDDRRSPYGPVLPRAAFDDIQVVADVLLGVLEDSSRDEQWRGFAARSLIALGQPFHRAAVRGVVELIRSDAIPVKYLDNWLSPVADLAGVFRKEIAQVLSERIRGSAA